MIGRFDDARQLFDRLLTLRNDVGLLAEQYDVRAHRLVGNFPQAFSHIALVTTCNNLMRASKPATQRSGQDSPEPGDEGQPTSPPAREPSPR
ncbi:MAG TPA: glycoside hydrolase family 15 protein, partial [Kofleriaceae bacterium]|nr:glycoside hydrolase family 15 protein [Kofleriaceae bacterium]